MTLPQDERYELKIKACYHYFNKRTKLIKIADMLNISRVTLNKLLSEALDEGLVRIEIEDSNDVHRAIALEEEVKDRFGLKDVRIANSSPNDIPIIAAEYIDDLMHDGIRIALTWGHTLELLVHYMKKNKRIKHIEVFTLQGAYGIIDMRIQPSSIAQDLLRKFCGIGHVMNAPFMCETIQACEIMKSERHIQSIIKTSKEVDITLVGLGPVPDETIDKNLIRYDCDVIRELQKYGVCGDISSNFYDIHGNICEADICKHFVRTDIGDIMQHKCVIGIAGGMHKVLPILGALNGGYLDVLISDRTTMLDMLDIANSLDKEETL